MHEYEFNTRMTLQVKGEARGRAFASRIDHILKEALRADGFTVVVTPGNGIPEAVHTEVTRITYVDAEEEE